MLNAKWATRNSNLGVHNMTVGMDEEVLYFVDGVECFFIELSDIELGTMHQATLYPVAIARVVATACVKVTILSLVTTKETFVRFTPIERLVAPLMQVNDAGIIPCLGV